MMVVAKGRRAEWLASDDDPGGAQRVVRIITPVGRFVHVTVPLQLDGILETGYWTPTSGDEHPLPHFDGILEAGNWRPDGESSYRPDFTRRGGGPELVEQPLICRSCGCATGSPGRWVIENYCDRCTNYGVF